jgi:PAS domain S-box-containing protein
MAGKTGGSPGRALLEHAPEMVTISDREGRILYANPATERVSGFAPEEFASIDPLERMHPEDRPRCEEAFGELLRNPGLSLQIEHRVRHKDGSWRWVEGTFASLFDDPEVGGLLATVRDVTEDKRAEEALRESEERYHGIFDSIDEGFVVAELLFNDEGRPSDLLVLETNASFDRMMRTTDAVGKRAKEIFPTPKRPGSRLTGASLGRARGCASRTTSRRSTAGSSCTSRA